MVSSAEVGERRGSDVLPLFGVVQLVLDRSEGRQDRLLHHRFGCSPVDRDPILSHLLRHCLAPLPAQNVPVIPQQRQSPGLGACYAGDSVGAVWSWMWASLA